LVVDENLVLRWEPIRRGSGQAHLVERLYRFGGNLEAYCGRDGEGMVWIVEALHWTV